MGIEMENESYEQSTGYTGNPFADMDYNLCKRCKRRTIDRSENPESVLCRDCREELIKLKIPPVFFVVGVLVILLEAFTLAVYLGGFKGYKAFYTAEETSDEGYIISTMNELLDILENNPDNLDAAIELTDIAMEYSYYDYASYTMDQYIADREVSDKQYRKLLGYVDEINTYYDTVDLSNEIWDELYEAENEEAYEEDDVYLIMEDYCQRLSEYIGDSNYDQALLYYYLGYMTVDDEQRNDYFEKCVAVNPCYFEAQAQIAVYCRREGNLERARQILEETYAVNKEDYAVLRSFATLELVEGNLESGLDFASRSYDAYADGDYVIDTYIVALAANGRMEEARELVGEYENNGYVFDDDLYEFLDGNMTLEDYYID